MAVAGRNVPTLAACVYNPAKTEHNSSHDNHLICHDKEADSRGPALLRTEAKDKHMNTTLLFTISISSSSRENKQIYSAQAIATNGEPLYKLSEGITVSEALEQVVQQMRLQERNSASFR